MKANIVLLPGDGIGTEVVEAARSVLARVATRFDHDFSFGSWLVGGDAINRRGDPLPPETLDACQKADAVLLGAVGGPKWDDPKAKTRPEAGLLGLRRALGLYANLRPVKSYSSLLDNSPLKTERASGVDLLIVRELTGGLYFGRPQFREATDTGERAVDTLEYSDAEVRRVVRLAFSLARGRRRKVTSIDKANVLESSRLWRDVANEVARDFPDVELEHQLVDSAAMRLVTNPRSFDVMVTENMFGDILSDEAAVLTGSLGMLPSASLGEGRFGLYEPIHGSAPDIAGKNVANPLGTISSAALLLRMSLGLEREAAAVERAIERAVAQGARTADLGGDLSTTEMAARVSAELETEG